jgi:hypothetical protein
MLKTGNAPAVSITELLSLKGQLCAVEFETRALLASGRTTEEVEGILGERGMSEKEFYWYTIPTAFRHEKELQLAAAAEQIDLSNEHFGAPPRQN